MVPASIFHVASRPRIVLNKQAISIQHNEGNVLPGLQLSVFPAIRSVDQSLIRDANEAVREMRGVWGTKSPETDR